MTETELTRVYAIKGRSMGSFAILSSLTVVQLAYGVVYTAVFRRGGENLFLRVFLCGF